MKNLLVTTALLLLAGLAAYGQTTIVADDYNVTGSGTGFALGAGVNSDISQSATRMTGTAAAGLRYIRTATDTSSKAASQFSIADNRLKVAMDTTTTAKSGRFSLSADGATAYDFGPALGIAAATAAHPVQYDITIGMDNDATGTARFSFALATQEGPANVWDFGFQLWRATANDNFYTIQKRIAPTSSGLGADPNSAITTTAAGTAGNQFNFLMRVTDAGAETGANYNSRLQLSMDGGSSWFYDTDTDATLVNGWRLDGAGRVFIWDQAGNKQGDVFYDNFSLTLVPEPSTLALALLGAAACILRPRR